MFQKTKLNPIVFAECGTLLLASLFLMVSGIYYGEWWAGFGLVLFMTSWIANLGLFYGPSDSGPVVEVQPVEMDPNGSFFPNGAIAFFVTMVLFFGSVWIGLYFLLIQRNGTL